MNDEFLTIFSKVSEAMKQASIMMEERATAIRQKTLSGDSSVADVEADEVVRLFKIRSLKLYSRTISFLSDEILKGNADKHFFLLPNARKLFDVYVRFLHLLRNCPNQGNQAITCISYQLMSYHGLKNKELYDNTIALSSNLIAREGVVFPDFKDFDYVWYLRKSGSAFSSNRDLLTEEVVNYYSNPPVKVFNGRDLVRLYGMISELAHGNPYFDYRGVYNERFWIATISLMVSAYLI